MLTTLPNRVSALLADPIQTVFRELNRDFTGRGNGNEALLRKLASLSTSEDGNCFHIEMDVPGIIPANIEFLVKKGRLTIRGERKAPQVLVLNQRVDPGTVEARLSDSVLHLKLVKMPKSQRQTSAINYAGGTEAKRFEAFQCSLPTRQSNSAPLISAA